jgi:hypothetical protein
MLRVDSVQKPLMLSRRQLLLGAAALGTAAALPKRLLAATAPHTFKHGDFEVTVVSDGSLTLPANLLGPDTSPEERQPVLEAAGLTGENVTPATNPVVIRSGSDLILFDTGSGSNFQPTAGKLEENLVGAGIDPKSITKVVHPRSPGPHVGNGDRGWPAVPERRLLFRRG